MVTAGSWPRWLTASGMVPGVMVVTALSGTSELTVLLVAVLDGTGAAIGTDAAAEPVEAAPLAEI